MQSNITRIAVKTRIPLLFISLFAGALVTLWAVGYAQAIPFVIPFTLVIGGPLMNFLTYEMHDLKEQSVSAQDSTKAVPLPRPDSARNQHSPTAHTA
jgi:hypothetical protein